MSLAEDLAYKSIRRLVSCEIIRNFRPDWLKNPSTNRNLEIDLWLPKYKIGFEIQGLHHLLDDYQIEKDDIKRRIFKELNYSLYELGMTQINEYCIKGILKSHNKRIKRSNVKGKQFLTVPLNHPKLSNQLADNYVKNAVSRYGDTAYNPESFAHKIKVKEILNKALVSINLPAKFQYGGKIRLGKIHKNTLKSKKAIYVQWGDEVLRLKPQNIKKFL